MVWRQPASGRTEGIVGNGRGRDCAVPLKTGAGKAVLRFPLAGPARHWRLGATTFDKTLVPDRDLMEAEVFAIKHCGTLLEEVRNMTLVWGGDDAMKHYKANPGLVKRPKKVAKPDPILRADAIVAERDGNRIYPAGLTPDGHVHAVVELLHRWGCRWYLPTEFGECIPEHDLLTVGNLDYAYASPFEFRTYWISWNGSYDDYIPFMLHNRMTRGIQCPVAAHAFNGYVKDMSRNRHASAC